MNRWWLVLFAGVLCVAALVWSVGSLLVRPVCNNSDIRETPAPDSLPYRAVVYNRQCMVLDGPATFVGVHFGREPFTESPHIPLFASEPRGTFDPPLRYFPEGNPMVEVSWISPDSLRIRYDPQLTPSLDPAGPFKIILDTLH